MQSATPAGAVERGSPRADSPSSSKGAVDAGSDIFLTNSFGGHRARFKRMTRRTAATICQQAWPPPSAGGCRQGRPPGDRRGLHRARRARSWRRWGPLTIPRGWRLSTDRPRGWRRRRRRCRSGSRTISAPEEYARRRRGCKLAGNGLVGGQRMTLRHRTGRTQMMGSPRREWSTGAKKLRTVRRSPLAPFAASARPILAGRTVLGFRRAEPRRPVIAKGNAGNPKYVTGISTTTARPS